NVPEGVMEIRAPLTVGCDGRHSTLRERAHLESDSFGAPMDVLWFRVARAEGDAEEVVGHIEKGRMLVMLNRSNYWQCAYVVPKGGADAVKRQGLEEFRETIVGLAPFLRGRMNEIDTWDKVKLLVVIVDRLRRWWKTGLLLIGDAAHAMSPIGGVGINLAIQDAVAAANILAAPLRNGSATNADLRHVQRRREFPTWVTQRFQVFIQDRVTSRVLCSRKQLAPPWLLRLDRRFPALSRIPARLIGMGIRPEHVRTPDVFRTGPGSGG